MSGSKRLSLFAVASAAAMALLTGCAAETPTESPAQQLLPAAEGTTQYPLTINTPYGDTVLEERPERIVAITPSGEDAALMLTLGAIPVAAGAFVDDNVYIEDPGPADIEHRFENSLDEMASFEEIAAHEPDAIVALRVEPGFGTMDDATFEQLSSIAPVITDTTPIGTVPSWRDSLAVLGEALDLPQAAQQIETGFDEHFATLRQDYPALAGATVTWSILYEDGPMFLNGTDTAPELFFSELGFAPHPKVDELGESEYVSPEMVNLLDADVLVLGTLDESLRTAFTEGELYKQLPVVQRGAVVDVDINAGDEYMLGWALGFGGPVGLQWAADLLVPRLSEAVQK